MSRRRLLIKLGGSTLQDSKTIEIVASFISRQQEMDREVILVHGGGPAINEELRRRGISWSFENGQRITTTEMMDVIVEVLENQVNLSLTEALRQAGLNAVPFSGRKNLLICKQSSQKLGRVGDVVSFDPRQINEGFRSQSHFLPVIAPLGCDERGQSLNINADFAAACTGKFLAADEVWFLTDQCGILDKNGMPIAQVDADNLQRLIHDGVVTGGMLTKVRACLMALEGSAETVRILKASDIVKSLDASNIAKAPEGYEIAKALDVSEPTGTLCVRSPNLARPNSALAAHPVREFDF